MKNSRVLPILADPAGRGAQRRAKPRLHRRGPGPAVKKKWGKKRAGWLCACVCRDGLKLGVGGGGEVFSF
jgi:hypothetical protein